MDSRENSDSKNRKTKKSKTKSKKSVNNGHLKLATSKTKVEDFDVEEMVSKTEKKLPGGLCKEDMDELKMFIRAEVRLGNAR